MKTDACEDAVQWLTANFIRSFTLDVDPSLWPDIPGKEGYDAQRGFFSIAVLSLMYCTAMAGLVKGDATATSEDTIKFLESDVANAAGGDYVQLYRERSATLYAVFRHRLVHQREPGKVQVEKNVIKWAMGRSPQDPEWLHLRLREYPRGSFRFWVHADTLYAHVLKTFETIRANIAGGDYRLAKEVLKGRTAAMSSRPLPSKTNPYAIERIAKMLARPDDDADLVAKLDAIHRTHGWSAPR